MYTKKVENRFVDWDEALYRRGLWILFFFFQYGDTGTAESSASYDGFTHIETIWQISKNGIFLYYSYFKGFLDKIPFWAHTSCWSVQ